MTNTIYNIYIHIHRYTYCMHIHLYMVYIHVTVDQIKHLQLIFLRSDFKRNSHNLGRDNSSVLWPHEFYRHSTSEQGAKISGCCNALTQTHLHTFLYVKSCFCVRTLESAFIFFQIIHLQGCQDQWESRWGFQEAISPSERKNVTLDAGPNTLSTVKSKQVGTQSMVYLLEISSLWLKCGKGC